MSSLMLILVACSPTSTHEDTREATTKALKTVQSWVATDQMLCETWSAGNLPETYTQQTLEKSQREINKETKSLIEKHMLQEIQRIQTTLNQVTLQVKAQNKLAVDPLVEELKQEQQHLNILIQTQERQP